jgi:hypothetical protein
MFSQCSIICDLIELDYSTVQPEYTYSVRQYLGGESIPKNVYRELRWEFTSADFYTDIEMFDFTASSTGNIYIAEDVSRYCIDVVSQNNDFLYSIERLDVPRREKPADVIQIEIEEFETWARQDQAYMGGYEPSPFYPLIELSGVDSEGNVWIRRLDSITSDVVFDIYDSQGIANGNAVLSRDCTDSKLTVRVDVYGMYALTTDASDNVEVYKLGIIGE